MSDHTRARAQPRYNAVGARICRLCGLLLPDGSRAVFCSGACRAEWSRREQNEQH